MGKNEMESKICVLFNGRRVVCSVTKYTTCDDVTEMVLYPSKHVERPIQYALCESVHRVEKMLPRKSSVLKLIRSWGLKSSHVDLLVKKMDDVISKKTKMSNARRKLEKIRSILITNQQINHGKTDATMENNLLREVAGHKAILYEKDIEFQVDIIPVHEQNSGKLTLMKRYLDDVANNAGNVSIRGNDECSYLELTGTVCYRQPFNNDLDTAFVDTDIEDIQYETCEDQLNECMIYEDQSDTESAFYDSCSGENNGSCVSENELERNVFEDYIVETDIMKDMFDKFGSKHNLSYDKAMESFMDTLICRGGDADDADEGLSSMGSDM